MVRGSTDVKDNELVAKSVKHWMNTRARRNQPEGIKRSAAGSIKKNEPLGGEVSSDISAAEGISAQDIAEEPGRDNPRPRRSAYMQAMARFKEMVGDEDDPDS
ncbi:hypothetical protein Pmar_PMAR009426 [Perkinsus marinus ATCC 50983]|uniref:Uncharacterized protein n=1 Tax=Perkinsus marinus (strain ATCC 50983 / TXsc) TaxID=423536 RepID=C5KL23_PERM5|nr:hypothetical protein Pmar_PMAR009426 [Perkinsus marinus ATCC 50983]EER14831.1 hypothetical protein Pmar_PMAR009426 [Perkinsus marinus ATCC 50983]|eukprot:XP_002783035.1 hypothetical protein Pmar_PMAR009426 [Perkinsus marinus ATCC 50983]